MQFHAWAGMAQERLAGGQSVVESVLGAVADPAPCSRCLALSASKEASDESEETLGIEIEIKLTASPQVRFLLKARRPVVRYLSLDHDDAESRSESPGFRPPRLA